MDLINPEFVENVDCKSVSNQEAKEILESGIIPDMVEIIKTHDGAGLAAPQVGINKRFFVILNDNGYMVVFNPMIAKVNDSKKVEGEGCLNYNKGKTFKDVKRLKRIMLIYEYWHEGKQGLVKTKEIFDGFLARVIQHEVDHLNGKTIFMR